MKHPRVYVPPGPGKPAFSPMIVRQKIVGLVRIESSGWVRQSDAREILTLTAHLEDGRTDTANATMQYKPGEREGLIERALNSKSTPRDLAAVQYIRNIRARMKQNLYAAFESAYGKGVPAA